MGLTRPGAHQQVLASPLLRILSGRTVITLSLTKTMPRSKSKTAIGVRQQSRSPQHSSIQKNRMPCCAWADISNSKQHAPTIHKDFIMPKTLTVYSAAFALAQFWEKNHREPLVLECTSKNALPHYTTLCRIFCSYSAAMSAMYLIVCSASTASAVNGKSFNTFKSPTRKCLGCGRTIRNEGTNVQHCRFCRHKIFDEDASMSDYSYSIPTQWRIFSSDDDLDDWDFALQMPREGMLP